MILKHDWYRQAKEVLDCNSLGDLHLQWLSDHHAGNRLANNVHIFMNCYEMLLDRKCIGQRNKFGEMPGDSYLWIEKCTHSKVIVYETQSALYLYTVGNKTSIDEGFYTDVHIRDLYYKYSPNYRKTELKSCRLADYKKLDFNIGGDNSDHQFCYYGDGRDIGYLASISGLRGIIEYAVKDSSPRSLAAIDRMVFWVHPTEHPEEYN